MSRGISGFRQILKCSSVAGEMERMVVELDTVRANLVSTAASGDVANQERLADRVRSLRDEMSAVSEGMDAGYGG